jgi:CDP-diacylglycerol--glycerol-3-phosphate 3-phosphatidyltransferase
MQVQSAPAPAATFTDKMRVKFKGVLTAVAGFFNRLGVSPNTMTLLGLMGSLLGAVFLALGAVPLGGLVILLSGALDGIDGTMARLKGTESRFGALLDSTVDRFSELAIFGALAVHFAIMDDPLGVAVMFAAAVGSVMVSYIKARAEGLGLECKVGLLTRMERYMVLCPALLLNLPLIGAALVAVLGNFTALQRIWHVYRKTRQDH